MQGCHYVADPCPFAGGNPLNSSWLYENSVYVVLTIAQASVSHISLLPNDIPV